MDVEKMKRINALARDLKEKGFASDTEEAYKKAEQIVEGGLESPADSSESQDKSYQEEQVSKVEEPTREPPVSGAVNFDRMELQNINDKVKGLEGQLNVMFTKINEIISEINKLHEANKKRESSPIEFREDRKKDDKKDQREFQASLKKEEAKSHPRTGGYNPDDVSIEKMFYFGTR